MWSACETANSQIHYICNYFAWIKYVTQTKAAESKCTAHTGTPLFHSTLYKHHTTIISIGAESCNWTHISHTIAYNYIQETEGFRKIQVYEDSFKNGISWPRHSKKMPPFLTSCLKYIILLWFLCVTPVIFSYKTPLFDLAVFQLQLVTISLKIHWKFSFSHSEGTTSQPLPLSIC